MQIVTERLHINLAKASVFTSFFQRTLCLFVRSAHIKHSRVADLPTGTQPLVDAAGCRRPRSALHHPHLHGPTDHRRHRQQEGKQAQGQDACLFELTGLSLTERPDDELRLPVCVLVAEGLWLPPGPSGGGGDAGRVLHHGPAVVRGSNRALHLPRQQSEAGVGVRGARRAAEVPGHQRAEGHRLHDLRPDGLLRLHDLSPQGEHPTWGPHRDRPRVFMLV